jgi:ABC-2 type transport system ATP-binding protein
MIEVNDLSKVYGGFRAVDNISISVKPGEIFAFLGVNGAGKTTTIRMLSGVLKPTAGEISIFGHSMRSEPLKAKAVTGYIPDRPHLYSKLTGREYLNFVADLYDVEDETAEERIDLLLNEYGLERWQNELVESYSHGMKQRLATCGALIHDPKLLIVDEPMVGLDPHGAKLLKNQFRKYAAAGKSIFLSTHSLNVAEELADRLAIIQGGRILTTGTLEQVKAESGASNKGLEELFLQLTVQEDEA